jgi:hypothetical protein
MKLVRNRNLFALMVIIAALVISIPLASISTDGSTVITNKMNFGDCDQLRSVVPTSDGGFVVAGSSATFGAGDWTGSTGRGGYDGTIVKFDDSGKVAWKANFGGSDIDHFVSVTAMSDGGFVAVGHSYAGSFGNGDWKDFKGKGSTDAIIVKFNSEGKIEWRKHFGGAGRDQFDGVTETSDGYIVAVGSSEQTSFGNGDWKDFKGKGGFYDAIVVKFDAQGGVVWKKPFGGSENDYFFSVTAAPDGGVVAVGAAPSIGSGDWADATGTGGSAIVKFDSAGAMVWKKNFGNGRYERFSDVTTAPDGGFIAVGYAEAFGYGDWAGSTGKGSMDATIVKFDALGKVVWKNNFGGFAADFFESVAVASTNSIIAVGYSGRDSFWNGDWADVIPKIGIDAIIVEYNAAGKVVGKTSFGGFGDDLLYSVTSTSNGKFVAVGYMSYLSFGNGDWVGVQGNKDGGMILKNYADKSTPGTTDPTNPTEPTDPTNPTEPTGPTTPEQPTNPENTESGNDHSFLYGVMIGAVIGVILIVAVSLMLGARGKVI